MSPALVSAHQALQLLKEGNHRFVNGYRSVESFAVTPERIRALAENGQKPFAIILGCADSRVPSEIVFDRGLGDLFVPRVAGNISPPYMLASIEYATLNLGTSLCVVMGHSKCGAIQAALNHKRQGGQLPSPNIEQLIRRIEPSVDFVLAQKKSLTEDELLHEICTENVARTVKNLTEDSPVIRSFVDEGRLMIVGAHYDLFSGKVTFFEPSSMGDRGKHVFS